MANITMYDLTNEALALKQMAYDDEIDEQFFLDTLDTMKLSAEEKIQNVAYVDRELKSDVDKLQAEIDFLQNKKKVIERRKDLLKQRVKEMMEALDMKECKCGVFSAKIVNNGGLMPIEIDNENVTDDYMKVVYEVDKEKIRKDLELGKQLSFARLKERGTNLRFK